MEFEKTSDYVLTKLGLIPIDWEVKRIDELARTTAGGTPKTSVKDYWGGEVFWMSSGDLNKKVIRDVDGRITKRGLAESSAKLLPTDSVLIGLAGQGKTRGTVAINKIELSSNQSVAAIIPNGQVYYKFLYYNLDNRYEEIRRMSTGDGGRGGLNLKIINSIKIPLPTPPEQKAIAQVLSTWDKAIENLSQLISEKQQKKKALMQQLLTGKKRFPGFDGDWKEYSYKELIKEVKRPVKWDDDKLYQLVSVRRRSGGLFERDSLYGHQILTKNLRTAKAGDFLISKMQILHGASAVVTEEFDDKKISGSYISVRARDENILDISFLGWYSKMPYFYHQTYISSYGVHIEKMTFDFKSFLKLEMKVPGLKEQQKIVATLESAEKEINILNQKLDALKDQKKGMMQQLLTGKKRIKMNND